MDSGYYAACAGLKAQTQTLEMVASNVANINTSGFRAQQPMFRSLLASAGRELPNPLNQAINDFGMLGGSRTDLAVGNLDRTVNPLDLAIEGPGFFAVQTQAGTLYTRNGNFRISASGQLTTGAGDPVLGEQGPITMPSGPASISADGTISTNGAVAGKLRTVEFVPGNSPIAVGNSYYSAPEKGLRPAATSYVRQAMLELSNVNPTMAVVDLITVQRHAEMLERAMSAFQSSLDRIAATDLPKL